MGAKALKYVSKGGSSAAPVLPTTFHITGNISESAYFNISFPAGYTKADLVGISITPSYYDMGWYSYSNQFHRCILRTYVSFIAETYINIYFASTNETNMYYSGLGGVYVLTFIDKGI